MKENLIMKLAAHLVPPPSRMLIRLAMICLWLLWTEGYAQQESSRQQADRLLDTQSYPQAIQSYTAILKDNSLSPDSRQSALYNLGYAYQKVGDYARAESSFRQYMELGEPIGNQQQLYLHYAQALAQNGKFQEAQEMFARFEAAKSSIAPDYQRMGHVVAAPESVKVSYRVESLDINTSKAEFSPAFFREGLVYISGKGSSQAAASTEKGFLDLYYVPNRAAISAVGIVSADNKVIPSAARPPAQASSWKLGKDMYTGPTANDSRTAASFAPYGFFDGLGLVPSRSKSTGTQEFSKELNTKYHEGPVTFSADGSTIIFTRNNYNEGKSSKSSDNVNKLKLYIAQLTDGGWSNVQELPFNSDEYSSGHPALSRDGKTLYFVSDRPGGQGGTDIYLSRYENGAWSRPLNLGPEINTKGDEMFPFLDENSNLYFSSNGRPDRLGELDIYFAVLTGQVPQIMHLDAPINSKGDDFGLITDGNRTTGYFSSNRLNGDDDIFRFFRESSLFGCRNLSIRVAEEGKTSPLDSVEVAVKARGEGRNEQVLYTDANGMVNICLEANNDFLFELSKDGYVSSTLGFSTVGLTDDKPMAIGASLLKPDLLAADTVQKADPRPLARLSSGQGSSDWEEENTSVSIPTLRGTVTGELDKSPIGEVKIILRNECDGSVRQTVTGPDGRYEFELTEGCDYTLVAAKSSYGTNTNAITKIPAKSKPKVVSANLRMLKEGDRVTLENINYDSGKWDIRKDAARELDKMVATMRKYPSLRIEIGSHTDSQGSAQFNQYLSERRAQAALNYLASKGIARSRMVAKGYGESQLVNQCKDGVLCTAEEHQRNRRTEFKVLFIR
jgi:outer membrane protein OmpA-like peptidoglycan-associated protein